MDLFGQTKVDAPEPLSSVGPWTEDNLEKMLKHMDLQDDELDDVILGKVEVEQMEVEKRWLAVGRLNIDCQFCANVMFELMKFVWSLSHIPKFR